MTNEGPCKHYVPGCSLLRLALMLAGYKVIYPFDFRFNVTAIRIVAV